MTTASLEKIRSLPRSERIELLRMLEERDRRRRLKAVCEGSLVPQPGPQQRFLECRADIAIYGGAAGGGKTWALLIEPLKHIDNANFGAVFFRRTNVQITNEGGLWDQSMRLYPAKDGEPNSKLYWTFPGGATISFAHLEHEKSVLGWQGSEIPLICCEVGTRVRMADGSLRVVERVRRGDMVATLRGPRRVTRTHEPEWRDCVEVKVAGQRQVQAIDHRLLTPDGWRSYADIADGLHLPSTCEPTGCRDGDTHAGSCETPLRFSLSPRESRTLDQGLAGEAARSALDRRDQPATAAVMAPSGPESDCGASASRRQARERRGVIRLPVVLAAPDSWRVDHASVPCGDVDGAPCARPESSLRGSTDRCSASSRRRDELLRPREGSDRSCAQPLGDVAGRSPTDWRRDEPGKAHSGKRKPLRYAHPYTGEERQAEAGHRVETCEMRPYGMRQVVHLSVESESHYITECGLVNQNCFDELTHFTEYQFWYLVSRNRSMSGVAPYIRATTNPDADSWVATLIEWWINQDTGLPRPERAGVLRWFVRVGEKLIWADTPDELRGYTMPNGEPIPPKSLTFIPSKLTDNTALMQANPEYMANLLALPPVERGRLLEGNWKIRQTGHAFFAIASFLVDGRGAPLPAKCDDVWAILDCATKTGKAHDGTGVIFIARTIAGAYPHPVAILDWDLVQVEGSLLIDWMPSLMKIGEQWARTVGARRGFRGFWIEDAAAGQILLQQCRRGIQTPAGQVVIPAYAIPGDLTSKGKDERALGVSGDIHLGHVKITQPAFDKVVVFKDVSKNHLTAQIEGFQIADPDAAKRADDLLDCVTYGTALSLETARIE